MKKSKKPSTYHHGDLKKALLDAGEAILSQKGPEGISLREIARTCNVSQTAPYRHFANKNALLSAIADRAFEEFGNKLRVAGKNQSNPSAKLRKLGEAYVDYGLTYPHRLRLMFGRDRAVAGDRDKPSVTENSAFSQLEDTVTELLREDPASVKTTTIAAWSLVHGFTMLILNLPSGFIYTSDEERTELLNAMLDIFEHGISTGPK